MDVELVGARGLERREDHRHVLRLRAGHHRVDGDLLDGALDEVGGHDRNHLVGGAGRAREHPQHSCLCRSDHGQAVGPPSIEEGLGFVLERGDLDPPAAQHRCSEPDGEHVDHVGIDRQRAAAGPHVGEARPQSLDGGERFPRRPGPAEGPFDLDAVLHPDQGRDGLDVVVVRDREVLVVDRCEALGEGRLVLGEDGELDAGFAQLMQDRGHEHTRGALGLDDGDDPIGQRSAHARTLTWCEI